MGHSIFSVSIVQFVRGKLRVLSETSDRVGGRDMDECLMREFAAQFQKKAKGKSHLRAALSTEHQISRESLALARCWGKFTASIGGE